MANDFAQSAQLQGRLQGILGEATTVQLEIRHQIKSLVDLYVEGVEYDRSAMGRILRQKKIGLEETKG